MPTPEEQVASLSDQIRQIDNKRHILELDLEKRILTLETTLGEIKGAVEAAKEVAAAREVIKEIVSLKDQLRSLEDTGLITKLEAIQTQDDVSIMQAGVVELKDKVDLLTEAVKNVGSKIASLSIAPPPSAPKAVAGAAAAPSPALAGKIVISPDVSATLDALAKRMDEVARGQASAAALQADVKKAKEDVGTLATALRDQLNIFEKRLAGIDERVEQRVSLLVDKFKQEMRSTVLDMQKNIGAALALKSALDSFGEELKRFKTWNTQTQEKVDTVSTRMEKLAGQLVKDAEERKEEVALLKSDVTSSIGDLQSLLKQAKTAESFIAKAAEFAQIEKRLRERIETLTQINNWIVDHINSYDATIDKMQLAVKEDIRGLDSKFAELRDAIEKRATEIVVHTAAANHDLTEKVDKETSLLHTDVDVLKSEVDLLRNIRGELITDVEAVLAKQTEGILKSAHFDDLRKELVDKVNAKLAQMDHEFKKIDDLHRKIGEIVETYVSQKLETQLTLFRREQEVLKQELEAMRQAYFRTIEARPLVID